jgi:transposase-like protein
VRWYYKYGIGYRDLAEMMQARGVEIDPRTTFRWVQRYYAPEIERRVRHTTGIVQDHGEWMRPTYELVDTGGTYFERSINTVG